MQKSLAQIKATSGRDITSQVDNNTLVYGETGSGTGGAFNFMTPVNNALANLDKIKITDLGTSGADANECRIKEEVKATYFYSGFFNQNVPRNDYAVLRCYQYGGGIRQYIDYTNKDNPETYTRFIQYNGAFPTNWEKLATKSDLDSRIIREEKNFTTADPSEVLDFTNLQNGRLHIFYSAVYGARWISCKVITQYNAISIIGLEHDGISVEDITSGTNMAVRFKRDSWNDYYCPIIHVII